MCVLNQRVKSLARVKPGKLWWLEPAWQLAVHPAMLLSQSTVVYTMLSWPSPSASALESFIESSTPDLCILTKLSNVS